MNSLITLFKKKNNTGTVARNASYLFFSEIILKIIGVLWIIFLAHSFSVENFGKYNLVTSFIAIFSFLPDLGIGLIVIREIAANHKKAPFYIGNSLFINGFLAILSFFIIIISALVSGLDAGVLPFIFIAGITLIFSTVRSSAIFYFDGTEKMQYSAILNTLNTVFLILFATLGILLGYGLYGIFIGMLFGTLISLFLSWIVLSHFIKPQFTYDIKTIKFYFSQSLPLGIAAFASLTYTKIDILVLSKMLGDVAVGIYSAATPFTFALVQLLNVPFVVAVYPALSRIESQSSKRFRKGIIKSLLFISLWSFPSAIFISLAAGILIPLIFGHKYDQAIPVLQVLIFMVPFMNLSALLYKVLIIIKKQKDYLIISIFGAVINLTLNIFLIPQIGIFGAAWATIITQFVLLIIYIGDVYIRLEKK